MVDLYAKVIYNKYLGLLTYIHKIYTVYKNKNFVFYYAIYYTLQKKQIREIDINIPEMIKMIEDSFDDNNTLKRDALLLLKYGLNNSSPYADLYIEVISNKYLDLLTFIFTPMEI